MPREEQLRVFHNYLKFAKAVARATSEPLPARIDRAELEVVGLAGLWRAVLRSRSYGLGFTSYVELCVRGAILDELRRLDPVSRYGRDRAAAHGETLRLFFVDADDLQLPAEAEPDRAEPIELAELAHALSQLTQRERQIVAEQDLHDVPQHEVARRMGITAARVSQIRNKAFRDMRASIEHARRLRK